MSWIYVILVVLLISGVGGLVAWVMVSADKEVSSGEGGGKLEVMEAEITEEEIVVKVRQH